MQKKLLLLGFAVVILGLAGVAIAGALKVELERTEFATELDPTASGQAILNYAKGKDKTEVQINCEDLTPEVEYFVGKKGNPLKNILPVKLGTFVAGKNGKGTLHLSLSGVYPYGKVRVMRGDADGIPRIILRSPPL